MNIKPIQNFENNAKVNTSFEKSMSNPMFRGKSIVKTANDAFTKVINVAENSTKDFQAPEDAYQKSHVKANYEVAKETAKAVITVLSEVVNSIGKAFKTSSKSENQNK